MSQVKELYKGKSLDDLKQYYTLGDLKKKKVKMLLNSAQKMYDEAEKCLKEGDEELSYIYFMKYFNLIHQIRETEEYAKEKQFITQMLGGKNKQLDAMDKTEALSKSLKQRYEKLQAIENEKSKVIQSDEQQNDSMSTNIENNMNENIDEKILSMNTCEELYKMTQDPNTSLLIMDCRPRDDFKLSRLKYPHCVNVPEEIIIPGISAGVVQHQLESDSKPLWASRSIKDNVLLMDWNSEGPEPILYSPIWRLRDVLQNWDPDVTYKSPIKILQGGYENYILRYPSQCTNPNIQAPSGFKANVDMLNNIEYPSLNDIRMKEDINYGSSLQNKFDNIGDLIGNNSRPNIDRSSKAAAMKAYDDKKQMLEMLNKQESIVDKTLETQKNLREAKTLIKSLSHELDETEIEEKKSELLAGKQELFYNIMQLETKKEDYKLEIELLTKKIEEYRRREKEYGEAITEQETEKSLEETARRVEEKQDQIDDEEKEKVDDIQEKPMILRNEKRHLTPSTDEDEISKPKIPQFDRSIKPIFKVVPDFIRQPFTRDFSPMPGSPPAPGLTGLKNLGNTCYMNSIMQCLSNTTSLVQYFKTDIYRKHINRSNKTKGKIVEEVAELIKVLWSGKFKCVASKDLRYVVGQYQQIFRGIEQQDSHEFLTILMDWLHSDLQTLRVTESPKDNLPPSEKAWLEFTKSCESYILRLFYGQIKSTVKCIICKKESATYECFSNLSLELPQISNRCDLYECLNMYFFGEKINGWNCPNCKQKRDAIKKLDISKLPPILVIHLKRFYADSDGLETMYRKKQTYVSFPLTSLDMKQYIAPSEQSRTSTPKSYHLYAVSNHYGSMESGHYTAFCKSAALDRWFKFDDQVVSPLDPSDIVSSAAYILFYTCLPETQDKIV